MSQKQIQQNPKMYINTVIRRIRFNKVKCLKQLKNLMNKMNLKYKKIA